MIDKDKLKPAIDHAVDSYPAECAGLFFVRNGKVVYRRCRNIAQQHEDNFCISPSEYAEVSSIGQIIGIVHSHPNASCEPSVHDVRSHKVSEADWYIIGLPGGKDGPVEIKYMPAVEDDRPLFGRKFHAPESDCYAFVRDWYRKYLHIELPDFYRRSEWWLHGDNLYEQYHIEAGFCIVDGNPQYGDLIVMCLQGEVANHGAVYLGDGKIAHHQPGRVSGIDLYKRYYHERTKFILRHRNARIENSSIVGAAGQEIWP